ncbi:MAG: hypothetical protein M1820_005110 [Bogoriella megaspora]|nr:MAG: hypothetical protein M1820_005110 [Bogoriella megaspora]
MRAPADVQQSAGISDERSGTSTHEDPPEIPQYKSQVKEDRNAKSPKPKFQVGSRVYYTVKVDGKSQKKAFKVTEANLVSGHFDYTIDDGEGTVKSGVSPGQLAFK